MYQPDYTSSNYQQYPFPHHHHHQPPPPTTTFPTTDPHQPPPSYASAPPFSAADFTSSFPHNYPPSFPHTSGPDPLSPTAPPPQPPSLGPGPEPIGLYSPSPAQYPPSSNSTPPYYPPPPYQSYQTPTYPNPNYDNNPNYEYGSGYFDENLSGNYGYNNYEEDGVYAYQGKSEPYGAHGTGSNSSSWSGLFDDYGRPISFPSQDSFKDKDKEKENSSSFKVVKAVPKAESNSDVQSGVQKFRVKLLPESGGSVMDVLCMVGLDGIRMLDPNTNRTLRIYPLESVTRCDKYDSSTVAFWSKTSVDVEPRRIRLQSNSYTTNTILDTMTAAIVQFKEMGGNSRPSEPPKALEQSADKKKGLTDWINKLKPVNEEKDHWVPDEAVSKCTGCGSDFNAFNRRHHCRNCGDVFCDKCTQGRTPLTAEDDAQAVRVCDRCMVHVTDRLSRAKEAATKSTSLQSHEDLAKKLQEEMEKNLRISSGSKSEVSGRQMREVACPTCTVHLQVQVPTSGSETIECGVCQHPFLVSAH